jgi:hypothetical protein
MKKLLIQLCLLLAFTGNGFTQTPKSHEECIKRVPGDWGPNFGDQWHHNEALYWGCRLGVPPDTVAEWQRVVNEEGMAQQILLRKVDGHDLVLIEVMTGTAHCSDVKALRYLDGWKPVWELPVARNSMDYCTGACPGLRMNMKGRLLTIESPVTNDPEEDTPHTCRVVKWHKEVFRWSDKTFERQSR